MPRPHRRHRPTDDISLSGLVAKYIFLLLLLGGVGVVTWVALSPLPAPTREVVRDIPLPPA